MGFVGRHQAALKGEARSKGPFPVPRPCSEASQTLLIAEREFCTPVSQPVLGWAEHGAPVFLLAPSSDLAWCKFRVLFWGL